MAALAINLLFVAMLVNAIFAWLGSPTDAEFADQPAAPFQAAAAGQPPKPRVVWLLFDEMDQRLSFSERPASVHMPELDRILHESVSAADAQPTALWTSVAMPSLISGLRIAKVEPKGPSELRITDMDGKSLGSWQKLPNLFQDAGKMGFNSGLVGWHHPYCRVLGSATSYCRSETGFETRQTYVDELGMLRAMDFLFRQQLDYLLQSLHLISVKTTENEVQAFGRRHQLEQFFANRGRALELVKDPRFGLIFVHWPIPHPVGIYNRRKHDFSSQGEELTYLDNLELVDVTLGELRRAMESAGLWDDTTLLITADNGFRPDVWAERLKWMNDVQVDPRETEARPIPFLIRLPGGHPGSLYSKPFNSLVTHDLILALLAGRIRTPEDAQNWLDQNRFRFPLRENHPQRRPDKRE
jgi:arylsulfatase A-like enzyme